MLRHSNVSTVCRQVCRYGCGSVCSVYAHVRVHVCLSLGTRICVNEGVCLYVWVYVSICEIVHVRLFVYDCALVFCVCVCVCGCMCV